MARTAPFGPGATEIAPTHWQPWYNLGVILAEKGDKAGGRNAYARALELAPEAEKAMVDLLLEHVQNDRDDQAIESESRIDDILGRLQGNLDPADREILRKRQEELGEQMRAIEALLGRPRPTAGDYARARVLREQMRKLQRLVGS